MERLESLQPRERAVLLAGAVAAVLIVFWSFVWRPLTNGSETLRAEIESKQQVLLNLYRAAAMAPDDGTPVRPDQALVVLVNETLQAHGLGSALTGTRPDGATRINVSFQNAAFDKLLAWLIALQQNDGVYVEGATINSTRQRGFVSGQLLLSRA